MAHIHCGVLLMSWNFGPPPANVTAYWVGELTDTWATTAEADRDPATKRYAPTGMVWWRAAGEIPGGDYAMRNFSRHFPHVAMYALGTTESATTVLVGTEGS